MFDLAQPIVNGAEWKCLGQKMVSQQSWEEEDGGGRRGEREVTGLALKEMDEIENENMKCNF